MCDAPVLALYSASEPVLVSVDASSRALGAALCSCRLADQSNLPLSSSRTQCRYLQLNDTFSSICLWQEDVTVATDHKPLEVLFSKPLDFISTRLQRMMLCVQSYDLKSCLFCTQFRKNPLDGIEPFFKTFPRTLQSNFGYVR